MGKFITWSTPKYSESTAAQETDSLLFADDVIRYWKFRSPFSIKFCLADAIRYEVDKQSIVVPPGGFFIANDGLEMECLPNEPGVKALFVSFTNALIHDVHRNHCHEDKTLLDETCTKAGPVHFFQHIYKQPSPLSGQMQALAQHIADSKTSDYHLAPDIFYSLAENLFSMQRDVFRQIDRVKARTSATREELFRRVLRAKEWMQDQWQAELTLNDIARHACLSPYHFHRSFREAFGESPMKWLRRLKLQKAKTMLETGGVSVTRAAYDCGFADVFSFSKAFRREMGVSPSAVCQE